MREDYFLWTRRPKSKRRNAERLVFNSLRDGQLKILICPTIRLHNAHPVNERRDFIAHASILLCAADVIFSDLFKTFDRIASAMRIDVLGESVFGGLITTAIRANEHGQLFTYEF